MGKRQSGGQKQTQELRVWSAEASAVTPVFQRILRHKHYHQSSAASWPPPLEEHSRLCLLAASSRGKQDNGGIEQLLLVVDEGQRALFPPSPLFSSIESLSRRPTSLSLPFCSLFLWISCYFYAFCPREAVCSTLLPLPLLFLLIFLSSSFTLSLHFRKIQ